MILRYDLTAFWHKSVHKIISMQCGTQFIFDAKSYRSASKFPRPFGHKRVSWPIASLSLKNNYVQNKTALYYFVESCERQSNLYHNSSCSSSASSESASDGFLSFVEACLYASIIASCSCLSAALCS